MELLRDNWFLVLLFLTFLLLFLFPLFFYSSSSIWFSFSVFAYLWKSSLANALFTAVFGGLYSKITVTKRAKLINCWRQCEFWIYFEKTLFRVDNMGVLGHIVGCCIDPNANKSDDYFLGWNLMIIETLWKRNIGALMMFLTPGGNLSKYH